MATRIPQDVLDALTHVKMPSMPRNPGEAQTVQSAGTAYPVFRAQACVVGSGAAGLRAAIELKRKGVDVLVLTSSPYGGTSACSGSDKQTLHTAGTSRRGDDFTKLAHDIGAGGCMDLDTSYIEAVGSLGAMEGLRYIGLPLPSDRFGAVLRYKTDHDEVGRATSCGPRTSRLMVKVLAEEAIRLGVRFLRAAEAVRLLKTEDGGRVAGVIAIDANQTDQAHGLLAVLAPHVVLATGGPGELYRDSVYPRHCYGSLGMAIEAGVAVTNITESQFGIGTRRQEFPWNLSGTYVQVMPRIYSVDEQGVEHNFLADWYRTTRELVSNVFRKGYQWPFHATRMVDFGSSLVDVAVFEEGKKGRTVYLDFLRNPMPGPDGAAFSLDDLDDDVYGYLRANGALQALPIERLAQMNPLAIELYRMHGTDLTREPLPFTINNQHMNGGVHVDAWSQSTLAGCYAVGEVAGTHGVTRPGGSALNAGQVAAMRCAEHIAHAPAPELTGGESLAATALADCAALIQHALTDGDRLAVDTVREQIQARMSDVAGFLCAVDDVPPALAQATALRAQVVDQQALAISDGKRAVDLFRWRHLAITSEAVLAAMDHYIHQGGGSRGARAYLAANGAVTPHNVQGALEHLRFRTERQQDQAHKLLVVFKEGAMQVAPVALRTHEELSNIVFEKDWAAYLTDGLHDSDFVHRAA